MVDRADQLRDAQQYRDAATLYSEALRIIPQDAPIQIQCGHMFKEAGELARAEQHYREALALVPTDADLHLQLGHLFKVSGRLEEAQQAYETASSLRPDWEDPRRELSHLHDAGWRGARAEPPEPFEFGADAGVVRADALGGRSAAELARLVPDLAPRCREDLLHTHHERIEIRRLGRKEAGYWGERRTLRGVEAIRGFCVSATPIVEAIVLINGVAIHRGPVKGGYLLKYELNKERLKKYVFNVWLDLSTFAFGLNALELRLLDVDGRVRSFHEQVVIAAPVPEADYPRSNALVNVSHEDPRPLEEQIRTRPSMVQPAERPLFPNGVRNVLAMRTDQLGDMVASIPAMRSLREIAPQANIVGLLTSANADLARTLDLFDEIIVVDFPDDEVERRRTMTLDAQEELRRKLEPYEFDIAIDLSQAQVSRELLLLSGAKFLYGSGGFDAQWLSAEMVFNTRDRWNTLDITPHSTKVFTLVQGLGALLKSHAPVIRRTDLSRDMLAMYGVDPNDRYAVLHTGARIKFSRWPYYTQLAKMLLEKTDLKIVMMAEDRPEREKLPLELMAHDRFVFLDQRLPFDHFDAFLSFATVVAGNDSGPKHLAALRGTNVVTLFTARINWTEWGQENVGAIMSRRVPCAGCAIFHDAEECGKDFACIVDIRPEEVFEAMMAYVEPRRAAA